MIDWEPWFWWFVFGAVAIILMTRLIDAFGARDNRPILIRRTQFQNDFMVEEDHFSRAFPGERRPES